MPTLVAARVLTDEDVIAPGAIDVEDGTIIAVREARGAVPNWTLVPGFVDLQLNGYDDIDVADAAGADWTRISAALVAHGTTTWCPTLVSQPLVQYAPALERIAQAARHTGGPQIAGVHLEGPFLGAALGAHDPHHVVALDTDFIAALPPIVRVITLAPELEGAETAARALADRGVLVAVGHSTADYETASRAFDAGARLVTHVFNGMAALHHRAPSIVGAALTDDRVAVSVIADLVHVHPAVIQLAFRAKPDGGVAVVSDAVAANAPGADAMGQITGPDGAVRLTDGTLAGAGVLLDTAVANLVHHVGVDLVAAVRAASATPARLLGLDDRGRIAPGLRADLVALDPDLRVAATWVGGVRLH